MKKISLFVVALLLIIPLSVRAAEYKVVELNATNESGTIKYNGTMEAGSTAVMCKLYDSSSNELDLLSSAVENTKFEGSFTVSSNGTYKVSCANYEGGEITEKTVEVTGVKNPKTGDNIIMYVSLGVIALLGIGFIAFRLKKQVK